MRNPLLALLLAINLAVSVVANADPLEADRVAPYGESAIDDTAAAIAVVERITGLCITDGIQCADDGTTVGLVSSARSKLAYIDNKINDRPAWKIDIEILDLGQYLRVKEEHLIVEPIGTYPKSFTVYIDSATGMFLEARVTYEGEHEWLFPEPDAKESTDQLKQSNEVYLGLPDTPPVVSMLDAMKSCKGRPLDAKEMTISYVLYSYNNTARIPCWIFLFRGLHPYYPSFGFRDLTPSHTTMRIVVNATTGGRVISVNAPVPLTDEKGNSYFPQIDELKREPGK